MCAVCVHVHVHACVHVCACDTVCVRCLRAHVYVLVSVPLCVRVCSMCVCVYVCMCVHVYVLHSRAHLEGSAAPGRGSDELRIGEQRDGLEAGRVVRTHRARDNEQLVLRRRRHTQ